MILVSLDIFPDQFSPLRIRREDALNCTFPIDRIPPEVLAETFHWYILMAYMDGLKANFPYPTRYCWMVIRHICRSWRKIALAYPVLSNYICITSLECVQDMLHRSGDVPLYI